MTTLKLLMNISFMLLLLNLFGVLVVGAASKFYDLMARDIDTAKMVYFEKYKGKVVLVVNVATECGYTDDNYDQLVELQNLFPKEKFAILAFPCNQFGGYEPESNRDIWMVLKDKYNVNFEVFQKGDITGGYAHPLFNWLKEQVYEQEPSWNFVKYLIDEHGAVVRMAATYVYPMVLKDDIETLVNGGKLTGGLMAHHEHSVEEVERDEL